MGERCTHDVPGFGPCEREPSHHGPCRAGAATFHNGAIPDCRECDREDTSEVLRLLGGGELAPNQIWPKWFKSPVTSARIRAWAERLVGGAHA